MMLSRSAQVQQQRQQLQRGRTCAAVQPFTPVLRVARPARGTSVRVAAEFNNPVRQAIGSVVSTIYKASASLQPPAAGLSPLWSAVKRLDGNGVKSAVTQGADLNERSAEGDTPLLFIAREGHYKFPPSDIPQALLQAGADKEAKDKSGLTALQVSLLSGWQNIAEALIKAGADTSGVAAIKPQLTCPDCKALVAKYNL